MAINLYPLLYKPGLLKDGTLFQSEYCTNGEWVRFSNGAVKKIGGQRGLNTIFNPTADPVYYASAVFFISLADGTYIAYVGVNNGLYKVGFDVNFIQTTAPVLISPVIVGQPNLAWQFDIIIRNGIRTLVAYSLNNATNIADRSAPNLYHVAIDNVAFNLQVTALQNLNVNANGGFCYASPYVFIYGSNGYVSYSNTTGGVERVADPFNFVGPNNTPLELKISNDKVIYGRPIRGGTSSPTLLFWTLSSVVRITNVGDQQTDFKIDVLSQSSSVLSSRCIVEYDGFFFWPGIDGRFYVFNGVVLPMENTVNQGDFFKNLNKTLRQKAFGVKIASQEEIWWFYPEVGQTEVTRAIIYNVKNNVWYDTAINRSCGYFFQEDGNTYTFGRGISVDDNRFHLWRHEDGVAQSWYPNNLGGNQLSVDPIHSNFTTPTFSWSAFNPMKQLTGTDRWVDLRRIEPDFVMNNNNDQMTVTIRTKKYAQSQEAGSNPIVFTGATEKIDIRIQGRHMSLEFNSDNYFEMGHIMLALGLGDGQ